MSLSAHIDNSGKNILILGKSPTQGLNDTTLIVKTQNSINSTRPNIKFCLSLACIIMTATAFYLSMLQKYINSKQ